MRGSVRDIVAHPAHEQQGASSGQANDRATASADARAGGPSAEAGRAEGPTLGTSANNAATAGQRAKRAERMAARRVLAEFTNLPRVAGCGRTSVLPGGEVNLKVSDFADKAKRKAGFGGLHTCGSLWVCPVCSAKITVRRAQELEQVLDWNARRGGSTALATFTVRHNRGHSLDELWNIAIRKGWRSMTENRAWKEGRKYLGIDHYIRATEVTHGANGWHVHLHVLLFFDRPVSEEMVRAFQASLYDLWSAALDRFGFEASQEHGVDVRLAEAKSHLEALGKYMSKLVFEASGGRFKKGREGGRTPFEILADFISTGLEADAILWWEYEKISKGKRQLTWSRGLKAAAGLTEVTDEEIAKEEIDGDQMITMPNSTWRVVYRVAEKLLDATEEHGVPGAVGWFRDHNLPIRLMPAGYKALGQDPKFVGIECFGCGERITVWQGSVYHPNCDPGVKAELRSTR